MIINLTQHNATPEQVAGGVQDLPAELRDSLKKLLTFDEPPTKGEIPARARALAEIAVAQKADKAMIGGALWLMGPLAAILKIKGVTPVFAFSRRETTEYALPDGRVQKTQVFRHAAWVEAL